MANSKPRKIPPTRVAKIKSMLVASDIKQTDIAEHLGLTLAAVSGAINGHHNSRRVRQYVAELLQVKYEKLWGKAA